MRFARSAGSRRLRRVAYLTSATVVVVSTVAFAVPRAFADPGASSGNLLVSTSVYDDVPNITAGTTDLPVQAAVFISNVTSSGTAPNIIATITSLSKNGMATGQTVHIADVMGATQVDGTWIINSVPSKTTFTIKMGSTPVAAYTGGGTAQDPLTVTAVASGQYPYVFNNDGPDANFGITEPIVLDKVPATTSLITTPTGQMTVPNSDNPAPNGDQLVTSFSSKSELALDQSTDGQDVTFMGYHAPTAAIDVSNSNTPNEMDPTNSDTAGPSTLQGYYRDVATMGPNGAFQFTETGAYGGNNGRAAILNQGSSTLFMAGNAGNGANPPYQGVVVGAGSQIASEASTSEAAQDSSISAPTPYGNFNITQSGQTADKTTKDNNFRGLTEYNNVIYLSKGSGGNGINTVYFVDTTGHACPGGASGVPQGGATLPSATSWQSSPLRPEYNTTDSSLGLSSTNPGLSPTNMCVLNGFSTTLASEASSSANNGVTYPFGLWFANPTTLYVADEGNGSGGAADNTGGLQKWTLDTSTNTWSLAYTLTSGLNLQAPYNVDPSPAGVNGGAAGQTYPTGTNNTQGGHGGNWAPSTDGLRNITGRVNGDGTVTIWATTSTLSGSGDQGADPNQVVAITDKLSDATQPADESFSQVLAPTNGVVYRGLLFTHSNRPLKSSPISMGFTGPLAAAVVIGGAFFRRGRRQSSSPA